MKRGQMEIAGLIIIVILITLGMLFALIFFMQKEPPEKKTFVRKGLAYSTMGALLRTSVQCTAVGVESISMIDLLEDCAQLKQVGSNEYHCLEQADDDICQFTEREIKQLLEATIASWNKQYILSIQLFPRVGAARRENLLIIASDDDNGRIGVCTGERDSSGFFPEQTEWGVVQSQLFICDE
jgi:hypothetical protein